MENVRRYKAREYALYKGDTYLGEGTIRKLSQDFGYTIKSLQWYNCKSVQEKLKKRHLKNHVILVPLNEDE